MRELCKTCDRGPKRMKPPSPYVAGLYQVHLLQEAGFPFGADSFDLQFWSDLATLKLRIRQKSSTCPMMGSGSD